MPVSVRTKTNFPLLTTTALVSAALLTVAPMMPASAANIVISTTTNAGPILGAGDTLTVTSTGVIDTGTGVSVSPGVTAASITNDGVINASGDGAVAVFINGGSDLSGGIINNSMIFGSEIGVWAWNGSDISGGLINTGTISSGIYAVHVTDTSNISGGITNSGTIFGTQQGISVDDISDITGGIINNASGTIDGGTYGIYVKDNSDISGGVINSGTISGATYGILLMSTSNISGGITNNAGAVISGGSGYAIGVNGSDISGGIINSGTISAGPIFGTGFYILSGSNISGGIVNNSGGIISGPTMAISVSVNSDISGGITNSGTISGGSYGIQVAGSSDISGGIINNASSAISANIGISVLTSSISGGITNEVGGIIEGTAGTAISLNNLNAATPITINGGRIIGDVIDDTPANGFSDTTIAGDFTTEGNFTVSDLTVSSGQIFTISAGNTVTLDDMSTSAGTFSFGVVNGASAGELIVTNGNVDLTGAAVSVTLINSGLVNGDEIRVAYGNAQVTGLTGAAGQAATLVGDNSFLWDFTLADGSQAEVSTGGADNTELYLIAAQVATIAGSGTNSNNTSAGTVLESLVGTTDPQLAQIITNLNAAPTQQALNDIIEATLPSVDGGAVIGGLRLSENTLDITRTQLAALRDGTAYARERSAPMTGMSSGEMERGLRAWGQVFGESADQDRRDNVAGYDADTLGLAVGFDTQNAAEDTTLGIALSYANTNVDSENTNRTETDVDGYQITLYGDHDFDDRTYVSGLLGYVYGDNESERHDVGGIAGLNADADYSSHQFVAEIETGRDYKFGGMKLTPNVLASYTHYSAEDYTETGAGGANLNVENEDLQMLELGVGLTAGWEHQTNAGGVLEPALRVGYRYDVIGDPVAATSRFTGGGASFKTEGFDPAQSSFNVGTGLSYTTPNNWDLSASYDYEFKQDFDAHSGLLKAGYRF